MSPRFPDFFVIGAPRCGTTALCRYLAQHPDICFSRPKETHYFARRHADPTPEEVERDYVRRFFPHYQGQSLVGEGSVSYLYGTYAIERVLAVNPDARMIVLLRNPLEMLPSYHLRMLYLLAEESEDLAAAWNLQGARMRGEQIPSTCPDVRLLLYREVIRFDAQVERLYDLVGRERALVLLFDDLAADPLGVYRKTLDFLGVAYDGRTEFPRKLPSRHYRYRWLQKLFYAPPKVARPALERALIRSKQNKRPGRKSWLKRITRWNSVEARPAPMSLAFRNEVEAMIAGDVERLSALLGRDLSHWLTPAFRPKPSPGPTIVRHHPRHPLPVEERVISA